MQSSRGLKTAKVRRSCVVQFYNIREEAGKEEKLNIRDKKGEMVMKNNNNNKAIFRQICLYGGLLKKQDKHINAGQTIYCLRKLNTRLPP